MSEWKIALCRVYRNATKGLWLSRIADIEDGKLKKWEGKKGFNSFYYTEQNNQDMPGEGKYGIWKWRVINEESDKLKTETRYESSMIPIEIIQVPMANSLEDIVAYLKKGFEKELHSKEVFFCHFSNGYFFGLRCNHSQLQKTKEKLNLKTDVQELSECKIPSGQYLDVDSDIKFFDQLEMKSIGSYPTKSIKESIQEFYRGYFKKKQIRAKWHTCRDILEGDSFQTVVEGLKERFDMSPKKAEQTLREFLNNIEKKFSRYDVDEKLLEDCIRNNPNLKEFCTELGRVFWEEEGKKEIEELQKKIESLKSQERALEQQKLELSKLEGISEELQVKIDEKREEVIRLLKDLAEVSPEFSGITFANRSVVSRTAQTNWAFTEGQKGTGSEKYTNPQEMRDILEENFKELGVENASYLSAFLCSAYWLKMPLLLAGPCGEQIAEVLSISLLNRRADVLDCSSEFSPTDLERAMENEKNILIVKTPFHGVWFDHLAYRLMPAAKCIIFLCPNADELCIEPQGIFTYLTPLVTDVFLGEIKDLSYEDFYMGEPDDKFKEPESNGEKHLKKSALFKKLKVHPFGVRKIRKLIFTMQSFLAQKEENTAELEMLFGLFPYAWLTRQMQVIQEEVSSCKLIEAYWKTAE